MDTHGPTPRLAASYGRKSYRDPEGIEAQYLGNQRKAHEHGFTIPTSPEFRFDDDDTVGITKSRAGFDRLVEVVTSGDAPFERVYIKDKTRLGRWDDPRYHSYLEVLFETHGVRIVYCDDPNGPIDYENADPGQILGRHLKDQVDNANASQERRRLRRRVTGGMRKRVYDGYYPGSKAPYGLRRTLVDARSKEVLQDVPQLGTIRMPDCHYGLRWADDGSLQVIVRIFELAEQGWSLRRIAQRLNADGLPSPLVARGEHRRYRRKLSSGEWILANAPPSASPVSVESAERAMDATTRPWLPATVGHILRNPIYCGDLVWSRTTRGHLGEPVDVRAANLDDAKEALIAIDFIKGAPISRARWMALQELLDDSSHGKAGRRPSNPAYLLTGLLRCQTCGATFTGFTKAVSGRRYYRHHQHGSTERREHVLACPGRARYVDADALEAAVLDVFHQALADERLAQLAEAEVNQHLERGGSDDRQEQIRLATDAVQALERQHRNAGRMVVEATEDAEMWMYNELQREVAAKLVAKRAELDALRGELELAERAREKLGESRTDRLQLRHAFAAATPDERKRLVRQVVERVLVDGVNHGAELVVRAY